MRFEWDENKARINLTNHHLSFAIAQRVFDDPNHLSVQDRHEEGEERWQTLGRIGEVLIVLVAHTHREDDTGEEVVRIISARKATPKERQRYEKGY